MAKTNYPIGKHPHSLENLKKGGWKPGQSGNPKGRPRNTKYITELAREKLSQPCPYAPGKNWAEYLVERWFGQAVESAGYFKELMDRLEGKVTQPISGDLKADVKWIVGKGYADDKPGIQTDKQETE
jgi:hypothetical protein